MKLTVVIVNYNVKSYLCQCLHSVERAIRGLSAEVVVVDNASSDDSVAEVSRLFPWVRVIVNKDNVGFSRANNMAIRESKADYVLLLNPDTIVGEEVLSSCVAFMDSHSDAGAVGVKMLKEDGDFAWESRRGVPTLMTSFYKMIGLCSLFPNSRVFGKYYMRYLDENEVNRIEIVSGAFMMLRRSALNEVGLLDETFFMYGEDIDLSYRLLKAGYQNYYLPQVIVHYKGESTQKTSFRYVQNFYNAMLIFYDKHFRNQRWMSWMVRIGIYAMGGVEYLGRQYGRLATHTQETDSNRYKMLVVGTPEMCQEVESLCIRHRLQYTLLALNPHDEEEHTLPLKSITEYRGKDAYNYIVFDTELFNYSDILSFMQREHLRKDCEQLHLGLYSMMTKTLVFWSKCFPLNS
jgi:GT2 family glycosyltransferase